MILAVIRLLLLHLLQGINRYWSSIILAITLPVGELHTYGSDTKVSNWILTQYRPMPESWNLKFAMDEIVIILYFLAWMLWKSNVVNRTTVVAFFVLAIMDTLLYFYNYKLYAFGNVYCWFIVLWGMIFYLKKMKLR